MTRRVSTTYALYKNVPQISPRINPNHYETTAQGKKNAYVKRLSVMTKITRTASTPNISTNNISGSSYCLVIHIPVSRHITQQQNITPPLFVV